VQPKTRVEKRDSAPTSPASAHAENSSTLSSSLTQDELEGLHDRYVRISDLLSAQRSGFRLRIDSQQFLIRGYEDDDYGDNGYSRHDDGTGDQCKGVGGAAVDIIVKSR